MIIRRRNKVEASWILVMGYAPARDPLGMIRISMIPTPAAEIHSGQTYSIIRGPNIP